MTLHGESLETESTVLRMLSKFKNTLENTKKDVGHSWSLDKTVIMIFIFAESGHLVFRAISALERGEFRSKEKKRSQSTLTEMKEPLN